MKKEDLRIIFMGTTDFAVESLKKLVDNKYNIVSIVTKPDKELTRKGKIKYNPVKQYALDNGFSILQPDKMKDLSFIEKLKSYNANLFVVIAFRILPKEVWEIPEFGTINIHASCLPQYRGAAPINWAIINGETLTGVTSFYINDKIDEGNIIDEKIYKISETDYVDTVYSDLKELGADLTIETLENIVENNGNPKTMSQDKLNFKNIRYAPKIFKENCEINWNNTEKDLYNFIRGLSPMYKPWTKIILNGKKEILFIFKVEISDIPIVDFPGTIHIIKNNLYISGKSYEIRILELQKPGKNKLGFKDFINGNSIKVIL